MPDPTPDIEKLLRLKRHERPPEGYFEAFVAEFRERQRAELLKVSAFQLARERFAARLHDWRFLAQPRWIGAATAAAVIAATGISIHLSRTATTLAGQDSPPPPGDSNPGRAAVEVVGVRPDSAAPSRVRPSGVVPAGRNSGEAPENSNGLRRRPGEGIEALKLVPLATPSDDGTGDQPAGADDDGQVIILVR
jgi:hypothetical protein